MKRKELAEKLAQTIADLCDQMRDVRGWDYPVASALHDLHVSCRAFSADLEILPAQLVDYIALKRRAS